MNSGPFKNVIYKLFVYKSYTFNIYINTHTHTHIYIDEWRQQVIIQANIVKDDGTLFIILNFIFSRLLDIFLV